MTNVGKSDRTFGKHRLLKKLTGRLTGAFTRIRFLECPFFYIDLCAGDGSPSFFSEESSPKILQGHANFLKERYGENGSVVILVEQDAATFDRLKQSPHAKNAYLIHGNSKSPEVIATIAEIIKEKGSVNSPCFVHNDPNKVSDFAITPELLAVLPRYTTSLTTMGCNVGGLKRLEFDSRLPWFQNVNLLAQQVRAVNCHNAYLASLHQDKSQWAYLVTCPDKWKADIADDVEKAFRYWKHGLDTAWLSEPEKFDALIRSLFLTKKEIQNVA